MKLLPIAGRELRVATRGGAIWWVRFASAGLAILTAAVVLMALGHLPPAHHAEVLFLSLAVLAFVYALVAGVLSTADCVSEEKREGTLGLLFLTNLRGYDVLAGKMVAHSLRAVSGLVALLPLLGLPLLMGSITAETVGCVALVVMNTMFLGLSMGVLVSVVARDARHAVGGALFATVGLLAVVPLLRWLFVEYVIIDALHLWERRPGVTVEPLEWVLLSNPVMLFLWSTTGLFRWPGLHPAFWQGLAVQHALGWTALIVACLLVPRVWRDDATAGGSRPARARRAPAGEAARTGMRVGEREPFAWIVSREPRPVVVHWAGLGVIAAGWLWGLAELRNEWLQGAVGLLTAFAAALWLKLRMIGVACRHLHEHRRSGALELVLCTAETPASIVSGNLRGMGDQFLRPLAATLVAVGLLLVMAVNQDGGAGDLEELLLTFLLGIGVLALDLWTIAWTGMWLGFRQSRYLLAWGTTAGLVLIVPWVLFVLLWVLLAVVFDLVDRRSSFEPGFLALLVSWFLISVSVNLGLLSWSRRGLLRRFRELALDRYGTVRSSSRAESGVRLRGRSG